MSNKYEIVNGWIVENVNHHTCGTARGGYYSHHEPGCGQEPICKVEDALAANAALNRVIALCDHTSDFIGEYVDLVTVRAAATVTPAPTQQRTLTVAEAHPWFECPDVDACWAADIHREHMPVPPAPEKPE